MQTAVQCTPLHVRKMKYSLYQIEVLSTLVISGVTLLVRLVTSHCGTVEWVEDG